MIQCSEMTIQTCLSTVLPMFLFACATGKAPTDSTQSVITEKVKPLAVVLNSGSNEKSAIGCTAIRDCQQIYIHARRPPATASALSVTRNSPHREEHNQDS